MMNIKYSKVVIIDNKVIRKNDLLQFAQLIEDLFNSGDYKKEIVVYFDDKSSITGEDKSIFESPEFERRKTILITFIYEGYRLQDSLEINLRDSTRYMSSEIKVRSDNSNWYHSTLSRINSIIDEIEPQNKLSRLNFKMRLIVGIILSAILSMLAVKGLSLILEVKLVDIDKDLLLLIGFIIIGIITAIIFNFYKFIEKVYPKLHLNFGPEYKNISLKLKKKIAWVLSAIVIPILLFVAGLVIK